MTLVSALLRRAYRVSNLIPLAQSALTSAQEEEGLALLNSFVMGVVGNGAGEELSDLLVGGENDQSWLLSGGCPADVRLVFNLSSAQTIELHPYPYEGQRLAVVDAGYSLDTCNATLDGNGRRIEAAATVALSTEGLSRQWLYRADTGNWVRITDLEAADTFPFPVEFDIYFQTQLALLLNPSYGQSIAPETSAAMMEVENRFRARYRKPRPVEGVESLGLMGQRQSTATTNAFNRGRPGW